MSGRSIPNEMKRSTLVEWRHTRSNSVFSITEDTRLWRSLQNYASLRRPARNSGFYLRSLIPSPLPWSRTEHVVLVLAIDWAENTSIEVVLTHRISLPITFPTLPLPTLQRCSSVNYPPCSPIGLTSSIVIDPLLFLEQSTPAENVDSSSETSSKKSTPSASWPRMDQRMVRDQGR